MCLFLITPILAVAQAPPRLDLDGVQPIDLIFNEPVAITDIYRAIAKAAGSTVLFDDRLREREATFEARDVTITEALDLLTVDAGHFWVAVDDRAFLVAEDVPQNRRTYDHQVIALWHLENVEVKDAMTILRSLLALKNIATAEDQSLLVMRDTDAKISVARRILSSVDQPLDRAVVQVALLRLDAEQAERLAAGEASDDIAARATRLLAGEVGLVGRQEGAFSHSGEVDGRRMRLGVDVRGKVAADTRDVELDLSMTLVINGGNEGTSVTLNESKELKSSWRLADGEVLLVPLPGPFPGSDDKLALQLTPRVEHAGQGGEMPIMWVGTEVNIAAPAALGDE
ncbi:MAG: hypothetical protein AAGD38_00655 [Acidobacteriota bacterium]